MIYLDNSATMMQTYYTGSYDTSGNANSPHGLGVEANKVLQQCRERVKKVLNVTGGKVIFGGTASVLVDRLSDYFYGLFDIVSEVDHDCLVKNGEDRFTESDFSELDDMNFEELTVSHIHTNNITGQVYNLRALGKKVRKDGGYFIMDTTATFGHAPIPIDVELWCDCMCGSSHKFGGPQGTGFVWVSDRYAKLLGLNDSPHDEYGFWPGTPAVNNIVAMCNALEDANKCLETKSSYWYGLTNYLLTKLEKYGIIAKVVDGDKTKTYAINAITLDGIDSDALVQYLSGLDIYVSPGHSACAQDNDTRVLEACGLTKEQANNTIRVSYAPTTAQKEIDALADGIKKFVDEFIEKEEK